jgi:hypothetical protein
VGKQSVGMMKRVFLRLILSGMLTGTILSAAPADAAPVEQPRKKKEKVELVVVEKERDQRDNKNKNESRKPRS